MTGPDAPSPPDMDDESDSGASDSDNLTNDATPILTGTGPADTTIRIYEGGVLVAEGTSDSAGNWSITLPAQSEGTHAYEVRSVDGLGNEAAAPGPAAPAGGEFRVNTHATDIQEGQQIATLEGGGFVVTWQSLQQDGSGYGVYAQRYDASGAPSGGEFRVNTFTSGEQAEARITALEGGGFVVTWHSFGQDGGSDHGVYAQVYDASGAASGGEFRVNTYTTAAQGLPHITALEGGGFVVAWESEGQDGSGAGVYAQIYDASGAPSGGEFRVNTHTEGDQYSQRITALEGGGFVVTWASIDQDGSGEGVYARVHDASGAPSGGEFRVNSWTADFQYEQQVTALEGGGFVVAWESEGQDGSGAGVYAQIHDASGAPSGGGFRVNTQTDLAQGLPHITTLEGGGFVVTWSSFDENGQNADLYAQVYDASGAPSGGEFRVNAPASNYVQMAEVTALDRGGFVVTWTSHSDGHVHARVYDPSGAPSGDEFQVNTYPFGAVQGTETTAVEGGGFVVTWRSFGQDGSSFGVYAQRYTLEADLLEVTVDTTAPDAPSPPDLEPTSDSGSTNSDDVTNDTTPTLTGTGPADTLIRIYEGATLVAEGMSDGAGNWSITLPEQAEGAHGYYAIAVDESGNESYATPAPAAPVGGEVRVNTYTTDSQFNQRIAVLEGGGYVVTWESNGQDGFGRGVYAQLFDAAGAPSGGEFRVNTHVTDAQQNPRITALEGGGFVVTWESYNQDGSNYGVYAQLYDAAGAPSGGEVRVNTTTSGYQSTPEITALEGGGFVIAWMSGDGSGTVYAQAYGADGAPSGGEFQVNTYTTSLQGYPLITALDGGGFGVVWRSNGQDGDGFGVFAQVYGADGTPSGVELQVNTHTAGSQEAPQITALDGGGFVVAWRVYNQDGLGGYGTYGRIYDASGAPSGDEFRIDTDSDGSGVSGLVALTGGGFAVSWGSFPPDGSGSEVFARVYNASGAAVGGEILVNTHTTGSQFESRIIALAEGRFVVTWQSEDQDGSGHGVYAQVYDASGVPIGGEFLVNTYTEGSQERPEIAALPDGGFVVTWRSTGQDGDSTGIYAQRFEIPPLTLDLVIDTTAPAAPAIDLDVASDSGADDADDLTNDATPTLSGVAEAGATVEILRDGTVVDSVTVGGGGNWSWTSDELAEGTYAFTARATDAAGNAGVVSGSLNVTLDTTAPTTPTIDLDAASDTGAADADDLTRDTTPTFSGTAEPDATVEILRGGVVVDSVTADGDGNWSWTSAELAEGAYVFTARVTDLAGNVAEADLSASLDATPPGAPSAADLHADSDSGVSDSDDLTNDTTPTLTGAAAAGATVEILRDGVAVASVVADEDGRWSWTSGELADGAYAFSVRATDTAGNVNVSTPLAVTIDTVAPSDSGSGTPIVREGGSVILDGWLHQADDSGAQVAYAVVDVSHGALFLNGVELEAGDGFTQADVDLGRVLFTHDGSETLTGGFTFTTRDQTGNASPAQTFGIDITPVNNAPTLTGLATSAAFDEQDVNAAPQLLGFAVAVADAEANFDGGILTVSGLLAEDIVGVSDTGDGPGQIGLTGADVTFGGVVIGVLSGGAGAPLTVTFNAAPTPAAIEALVQGLTYANSSDTPTASRNLLLNLTDAEGADLGAAPGPPTFATGNWASNPFNGVDVGWNSTPAFVDLDGDGDLDAVVGAAGGVYGLDGTLRAFENTAAPGHAAAFAELTGAANPFEGIGGDERLAPAFADLDGDGDLDLVMGASDGALRVFQNTAGAGHPAAFSELTGAANPFDGVDVDSFSAPSFVDLDGDGDLDAVVGGIDNYLRVFENTAAAGQPATFAAMAAGDSPFASLPFDGINMAVFADVDGDGDLDALVAEAAWAIRFLENTAESGQPAAFTQGTGAANPFEGATFDWYNAPALADLDGDGDLDLVAGGQNGLLTAFLNTTPHGRTITVTVAAADDASTAVDDLFSVTESSVASGSLFIDNGSGPDADLEGDAFEVTEVNGSAASVGTRITLASGALLTVNADGTYSYDPNGAFDEIPGPDSGAAATATDSFTYTVTGGGTATVTVTIVGEDNADTVVGDGGGNFLNGGDGDDILHGGAGNDFLNGGAGDDVSIVSGAFSDYRLLMNGDDFILKGPDGRDHLTGVETIRFGDGRVLELNRMYGPDVDSGAWADGRIPEVLLSGGSKSGDQPLVLPGLADDPAGSGKGPEGPSVLPALSDDEPLVLPGPEGFKAGGDDPLVLPGVDDATPLFPNLEARLALTGGWTLTLDGQGGLAGEPVGPRHDDWM